MIEIEIELIESSLRRQRVFRDRLNPLDAYSDFEFITRYRITQYMFLELLERISTNLNRTTARSYSIPPATQLAVALQFLATGTFQTVVASAHGISQTSVSRCVTAVCEALTAIAPTYIQFPNKSRQKVIQKLFLKKYKFPLVLGCIDCSHVSALRHHRMRISMLTERDIILLTYKRFVTTNFTSLMLVLNGRDVLMMLSYGDNQA